MLPGLRLFSGIDNLIPLVTQAIADRGNNVGISVYRSLDDGSSDDVYPPLAQVSHWKLLFFSHMHSSLDMIGRLEEQSGSTCNDEN